LTSDIKSLKRINEKIEYKELIEEQKRLLNKLEKAENKETYYKNFKELLSNLENNYISIIPNKKYEDYEQIKKIIDEYNELYENKNTYNKEIKILNEQLKVLNNKEEYYNDTIELLSKKIIIDDDLPDEIKNVDTDYNKLKLKLEKHKSNNINKENINYEKKINLLSETIKIKSNNLKEIDYVETSLNLNYDDCIKRMNIELEKCKTTFTEKDLENMKIEEKSLRTKLKKLYKENSNYIDETDYYRIEGAIDLLSKMIEEEWEVNGNLKTELKHYKTKKSKFNTNEIKKQRQINLELKNIEDEIEKLSKEIPIITDKLEHYEKYKKYKNHLQHLEYEIYIKKLEEINELKKERDILEEKQKYYTDINWNIIELYLPKMKSILIFKEINTKIDETNKIINDKLIVCIKQKENIQTKINDIKKNLNSINIHKTINNILSIIDKNYFICIADKTDIKIQINIIENKISEYNKLQLKIEKKEEKKKIYDIYLELLSHNGLSYEILKSYIKNINNDINIVLKDIVNFIIKIDLTKEKKTSCININAIDKNNNTNDIISTSGFEQFITSLAIRIVLGRYAMTPKPNFIIIDEGWSCLDKDNLNNINVILEFLQNHFDHTIIISHINEIKDKGKYKIQIIKKINNLNFIEYSYIKK
jgi:DNA repair exonuclease SbcCD ATPase subunit